uniref:Uncharacterized protein n=1 Tax=Picea sitchensis TaxID=3332 RepID=A0A6B9XR98_PICSI|nr:hypothetical protein Q903MT_gene5690 [Picea sitchensis]
MENVITAERRLVIYPLLMPVPLPTLPFHSMVPLIGAGMCASCAY